MFYGTFSDVYLKFGADFFLPAASNFGAKIQINVKQKKMKTAKVLGNFYLSKWSVAEFSVTITTLMQG